MFWNFKGCSQRSGDLTLDEDIDIWRCWQCGRYYYFNVLQCDEPPLQGPDRLDEQGRGRAKDGSRAIRNIDSMIRAKMNSDERWWARNQQIIAYLDDGRTVREISMLMMRGQRQIRVVRERLGDLRAGVES